MNATTTRIGVVGPDDVVRLVLATVGDEPGDSRLVPLPYEHEDETTTVLRKHTDEMDGWLFTGVVPYERAEADGALSRPARYVDYTGDTLLGAIMAMVLDGVDVSVLSVDTLDADEVRETLSLARIPLDGIYTCPYRAGLRSRQVIAFHEEVLQRRPEAVAVTCLGSVFAVLREETRAVRLLPSGRAIREALRALELAISHEHVGDAQVVIGQIALPDADPHLATHLAGLAPFVADEGGGRYAVTTTRGPLETATSGFTTFPALEMLAAQHESVHVGFGLGSSAAEAGALAKQAMKRAQSIAAVAACMCARNGVITVLDGARASVPLTPANLAILASRSGLSRATLIRLRELAGRYDSGALTTRDVAEEFAMKPRTARRLLNRLQSAGAARVIDTRVNTAGGRPLLVYRINL